MQRIVSPKPLGFIFMRAIGIIWLRSTYWGTVMSSIFLSQSSSLSLVRTMTTRWRWCWGQCCPWLTQSSCTFLSTNWRYQHRNTPDPALTPTYFWVSKGLTLLKFIFVFGLSYFIFIFVVFYAFWCLWATLNPCKSLQASKRIWLNSITWYLSETHGYVPLVHSCAPHKWPTSRDPSGKY